MARSLKGNWKLLVLSTFVALGGFLGSATAQTSPPPRPGPAPSCVGSIEDVFSLWTICKYFPAECAVLSSVFPRCPNPQPEDRLLAWSADGALVPPGEAVDATDFFFSLRKYDTGEVIVDVVTTSENVEYEFERNYIGKEAKDIRDVLDVLHVSRLSLSSKRCPELRKVAKELQEIRVLAGPDASVVVHPTTVLLALRGSGQKSVNVEDGHANSELAGWVARLRGVVERFLPAPKKLLSEK